MHFAMSPDSLLFFYAVVASVTAAFGLFSLYKHLTQHRRRHFGTGDSEEHRPLTVAPSLLVPQFMYNRLVRHSGKGAGSTECAVCLGVIQVGAMAKLLPACTHVYHVDCIDLWLASHSTCPLCRSRVGDHSRAGDKTVQDLAYLSPV
ncbi:RING-H2 finger protein ATL39-like [Lolium rigidum]|uniref:RING-H2 finger protein ATL39-like n=1 Tax=Lolium rigidum TaxID=89674 RepID=UPI001F5CCFFF|nr:RING-H2 finger protein ATL39-like [Lolium rigidum]XP_047052118.1 RING-H2 finger protein ATL39-like [Lolium rigidum]XP_051200410.1 RING-H2 finger protein ATL39-like [Lolium perenne]